MGKLSLLRVSLCTGAHGIPEGRKTAYSKMAALPGSPLLGSTATCQLLSFSTLRRRKSTCPEKRSFQLNRPEAHVSIGNYRQALLQALLSPGAWYQRRLSLAHWHPFLRPYFANRSWRLLYCAECCRPPNRKPFTVPRNLQFDVSFTVRTDEPSLVNSTVQPSARIAGISKIHFLILFLGVLYRSVALSLSQSPWTGPLV